MANRNKNKGTYHEKWFVDWLNKIKAQIKAKRQPLSGSLGGEYSGDIKLEIKGLEMVGEVKYRDTASFPSPFKVSVPTLKRERERERAVEHCVR